VHEDRERSFLVRQQWESDTPFTVVEIRADGIMPEKFIQLFQHFEEQMPEYFETVRTMRLADDHGFKIIHQRITMPVLVFNRSFFNCYYQIDGSEPGEYTFMVSGWGNEYF
jgi:hypothetical protein